jgi:hypothetical protein
MAGGKQLFPEGKRLIAHWNLRDELKAAYGAGDRSENLARQRALQALMEAIVRQSIPQAVIDNPELRWDLGTSVVTRADGTPCPTAARCTEREPDTRYARWLEVFRAMRAADPYDADNPTFIARRFNRDRELPQQEVERLLTQVLDSPLAAQVAETIRTRLGRRLEPFDLWYAGFKPAAAHAEADLDRLTRARYPNAAAFQADIPRILRALGFSAQQTDYLAARITVDPSRGAGHALQMARRDDLAHLRTHIKPEGMDYKGYNIAIHELGHNVEQVFSVTAIDETLLSGVPNNAFTEALAFLFQARDLELLGLPPAGAEAQRDRVLEEFWATREISAVALVDLRAWQWLYAHPDARPAQFREAVVQIAAEHWDRWFAPYLGGKGSSLLAIYSHLLQYGLYLPDYALGHLIALQIEQHFAAHPGEFGAEWERVTRLGRLTPDLWMRQAVGAPLSADPLLRATTQALSARAAGSAPARSAP